MRDPVRIPRILGKLLLLWERNPDARFNQLLYNIILTNDMTRRVAYSQGDNTYDPFFLEDLELERAIDVTLQRHENGRGWQDA